MARHDSAAAGEGGAVPNHGAVGHRVLVSPSAAAPSQARALVAILGGRWSGSRGVARCPAHRDREPSLSLAEGDDGRLLVRCFAGCTFQAILDALRHRGLLPERGARWAPPDPAEVARRERERREEERRRTGWARRIWTEAVGGRRPPVRAYLASRGIPLEPPPTMRFGWVWHREAERRLPAMIAAIQAPGGALQGVHATFLRPNGGGKPPVEPARKIIGIARNGAVRLGEAGPRLAVAEGIETGLSVLVATGVPVWAALSAGGIRSLVLPPLPLAAEVTICADHDPVGLAAAQDAAERWHHEGRRVRIAMPPVPGTDFNDLALAAAGGAP